jgi:hypothetical protein
MLKFISIPVAALLLTLTFSSCEHEHVKSGESFFPLEDGFTWTYQRWQIINVGDNGIDRSVLDTITLTVAGDTLIDGQKYKNITSNNFSPEKAVRQEGTKYFGRHHELYGTWSKEYMFLDTSVPVGGTWTHIKEDEYISKTVYEVKAVNSSREIGGKQYTDLIEVEASYYYKELEEEKLWLRAIHYYSKDGGEIYNYYPYPASGRFSDVEAILISTQI